MTRKLIKPTQLPLVVVAIATVLLVADRAAALPPSERISVSPDGKVLAAALGRGVYILNPATLQVTKRLWNGSKVEELGFSKDSACLVLTDYAKRLRTLDISTGKFTTILKDVKCVSFAPNRNLVIVTSGGRRGPRRLRMLSMIDGEVKFDVALPDGFTEAAVALRPDGKQAVVLSEYLYVPKDKRPPSKKRPAKFASDLARAEFTQRNDLKYSKILTYETLSGKLLNTTETWYTVERHRHMQVFYSGKDIRILQFGLACALVSGDGKTTLFKIPTYNYGAGWSGDGSIFVCASLAEGYYVRVGKEAVKFKVDRLPGWPEYFRDFGVTDTGTAYGVTDAGRIAKISGKGELVSIVPLL
ncbi:MAG: hypothetical protein QGG42_19775 [Phycisphaerae bacterium]|jgi:WD40 repeat protein|nr:hypothetical protein [Phycisphaerae bacterium]